MNIIWTRTDGGVSVSHLSAETIDDIMRGDMTLDEFAANLQSPQPGQNGSVSYRIDPAWKAVATNITLPTDSFFHAAWSWNTTSAQIDIDIVKARDIAHIKRRAARAAEFAPLDIMATIPAQSAQAEAARQLLRDKYAVIQQQIDAAATVAELKATLPVMG